MNKYKKLEIARKQYRNWKKSSSFKNLKIGLYLFQCKRCAICKKEIDFEQATMDHVIPLSKTLKHDPHADYQITCKKCNEEKDNPEWLLLEYTKKNFYKKFGYNYNIRKPKNPDKHSEDTAEE